MCRSDTGETKTQQKRAFPRAACRHIFSPTVSPCLCKKASTHLFLTSRVVDRPIRPLFPKDMRNDVSVVMTVLAVDPDNSPEIVGMIATSIAISISDIP